MNKDDTYILPAPEGAEGYVGLSRTRQGKLFKKHLLTRGTLYHDSVGSVEIDDDFLSTVKRNFDNRVCDIVQVPLANAQNQHSEDPRDNLGEVIDVEVDNGKLYAYIDIRDKTAVPKMGSTYLGSSAAIAWDYIDQRTGLPAGPTLLHSCVTNRPHLNTLEDYQEVMATLSSDTKGEAVLLSATATAEPVVESAPETETQEEKAMTLEEMLAALKTEHNIDVSAIQARNAELENTNSELTDNTTKLSNERDEAVKLSNDLTQALGTAGVVNLSESNITPADVIGAVSEIAQNHITLSNTVKVLAEKDAGHEVQELVDEGRVPPTQKKWLVSFKLSNPTGYAEFLDTLPETPAIPVEREVGVTTSESDAHNKHMEEIARLTAPGGPAYAYINRSGTPQSA